MNARTSCVAEIISTFDHAIHICMTRRKCRFVWIFSAIKVSTRVCIWYGLWPKYTSCSPTKKVYFRQDIEITCWNERHIFSFLFRLLMIYHTLVAWVTVIILLFYHWNVQKTKKRRKKNRPNTKTKTPQWSTEKKHSIMKINWYTQITFNLQAKRLISVCIRKTATKYAPFNSSFSLSRVSMKNNKKRIN